MPDAALSTRLAAAGLDWIVPDWPASPNVHALSTTRNLGPAREIDFSPRHPRVDEARRELRRFVPREPVWLAQAHGALISSADTAQAAPPQADGTIARTAGNVCSVLTGDCLPVLLTDRDGTVVAAAHAGWRGLAAGVLEAAVGAMRVAPASVLAWLGPAIGPQAFEVGDEVYAAFCDDDPAAHACFVAQRPGKWHADLYALARRRLAGAGVPAIHGGGRCTLTDRASFYSYRRGGADAAGRMATVIWRE